MRTLIAIFGMVIALSACKKKKEDLTKTVEVTYKIETKTRMYNVEHTITNGHEKWKLPADSGLFAKTVKISAKPPFSVYFSGWSTVSGDFTLFLFDDKGNLLEKTDTMNFLPSNQFHPDQYTTTINYRIE